jgi:hypothetical protein
MQLKLCRYTLRKNINTNTEGFIPYKSQMNLCNIYLFAADNVTPNTTAKNNTSSVYNKREKLWILVCNQSATEK